MADLTDCDKMKERIGRPLVWVVVVKALYHVDKAKVKRFVALLTGDEQPAGEHESAAVALQQYLLRRPLPEDIDEDDREISQRTITAMRAFELGQPITGDPEPTAREDDPYPLPPGLW